MIEFAVVLFLRGRKAREMMDLLAARADEYGQQRVRPWRDALIAYLQIEWVYGGIDEGFQAWA